MVRERVALLGVSKDQMRVLAHALARVLQSGDVIFLCGEMGAGKTYFTQMIGEHLKIDSITSPSFNLMKEYQYTICAPASASTAGVLFHLDLWRMESVDEFWDLDIDFAAVVCIVEWADKFPINIQQKDINILKVELSIDYANIESESLRNVVLTTESEKFRQFLKCIKPCDFSSDTGSSGGSDPSQGGLSGSGQCSLQ